MLWSRKVPEGKTSGYIDRKEVMKNILAMSNALSHEKNDSQILRHWHSYLENLCDRIKSVISQPDDAVRRCHLDVFQMGRIGDFLESMDKQNFSGEIYEIYEILDVDQPQEWICREEMILIYLLSEIVLSQFQIKTLYSMKPFPSKEPIALK